MVTPFQTPQELEEMQQEVQKKQLELQAEGSDILGTLESWEGCASYNPEIQYDNGRTTIWRCISYRKKLGFSNVMLVFRDVSWKNKSPDFSSERFLCVFCLATFGMVKKSGKEFMCSGWMICFIVGWSVLTNLIYHSESDFIGLIHLQINQERWDGFQSKSIHFQQEIWELNRTRQV